MDADKGSIITLCGSLSAVPVALGAAMHNAGYRALGLPFTYVPFGVRDLGDAVAAVRALGIRGVGISVPFKQQVIPLLDELDPSAARVGAVNTVVNEAGRLFGHNTDGQGAVRALGEALRPDGAEVLLLGAGGAARAVAHALSEAGARLSISNRSEPRGRELADAVGAAFVEWQARARGRYDAIVNATTVGMADPSSPPPADPSPLPEEALGAELVVMDIVYKPIATSLLEAARRRGATTLHGGRMLLHQAARQFELYTGCCSAPIDAMEQALDKAIAEQG